MDKEIYSVKGRSRGDYQGRYKVKADRRSVSKTHPICERVRKME